VVDRFGYDAKSIEFPVWIVASGCAEVLASCVLCPLEATKIYMMMNPEVLSGGILSCVTTIIKTKGLLSLYSGLPLLLLRQVPYTCVKLSGYEMVFRFIRHGTSIIQKRFPKLNSFKDSAPLEVTQQLTSGVFAGIGAAVVSQPADVLLSKLCGSANDATVCLIVDGLPGFIDAMKDLGFRGCFSGLVPRATMVGVLTALQFGVYEKVRRLVPSRSSSLFLSNKIISES
jgi:solute carrier family 25 phosphate transporter 3